MNKWTQLSIEYANQRSYNKMYRFAYRSIQKSHYFERFGAEELFVSNLKF
ncbi:MAG: hypothetical protein LBP85_00420 [Prevotellaceae bacterium]|nr:hypothetical protein [Prevotellaceae bacterium]